MEVHFDLHRVAGRVTPGLAARGATSLEHLVNNSIILVQRTALRHYSRDPPGVQSCTKPYKAVHSRTKSHASQWVQSSMFSSLDDLGQRRVRDADNRLQQTNSRNVSSISVCSVDH